MTLLALEDVTAAYGDSRALFGVSLEVGEGRVVALMGRNGTGKTTTVRTICRMLPATGGTITFDGVDLGRLRSHRVARLGIGLVPEGRRIFPNLTVRENLVAAATRGTWTVTRVTELFPRLGERLHQWASTLSGGEQQMLAIGRALMTNPRLLILDEATEGLAPVVRREIWEAVRVLKSETGLALLVIDKSLAELRRVSDHVVVLERGKRVWNGPTAEFTQVIADRFLGV